MGVRQWQTDKEAVMCMRDDGSCACEDAEDVDEAQKAEREEEDDE